MSNEFNKEALDLLLNTARDSVHATGRVCVIPLPGKSRSLLVNGIRNTTEFIDHEEPPRNHNLLSINDVIEWARAQSTEVSFAARNLDASGDVEPVKIWVCNDEVVVTLESPGSRIYGDHANYEFKLTNDFTIIQELEASGDRAAFDQKSLIKFIRVKLWDLFENNSVRDALLKSLRNVVAQQTSNMNLGKGTFEASMATSNGQTEQWPDRITLLVRVFDDPTLLMMKRIDVVFDVDPHTKQFTLTPTLSTLEAAVNETRSDAVDIIRQATADDEKILVYMGSP